MRNQATCLLALALACVCGGCNRTQPEAANKSSGSVGVTNAQPSASRGPVVVDPDVVEEFANAWCQQDRSCDRVGAGRQHPAFFDCVAERRDAVRTDLQAIGCPHGIRTTQARKCADELEQVDCANPTASLLSLAQCQSETLCAK